MSGGWWGNYLWLDLASFFFRLRSVFFQVNRKKDARGLAQTIISGPIRGRFFSGYGTFFFRLRQPGNVILRYAGVLNREMDCQWEPRGDYLEPDSGAFFFRLRSRFFSG